jgi:hypothetical protein
MNKNYLKDLEKLGIYENAFKNWCSDYENLVYQKFEEHCDSFDIYFDISGNISWEDGEFISEEGNEDDPKLKLNELNSSAQNKALNDWVYSYSDIVYEAFDNYAKAFKLYFDDNGNILGEDE